VVEGDATCFACTIIIIIIITTTTTIIIIIITIVIIKFIINIMLSRTYAYWLLPV
jgi:hypothetical protein